MAFCRDNGVPDADKIADRFDILFKRRFDKAKLDSLSGEDLEQWLERNLLDVLRELPGSDRAEFFDEAIGTSMAEKDADVIDILLGMGDENQNPESKTKAESFFIFNSGTPLDRLHKAMGTGDAKAIAVWHRLVVGTTLFKQAKPQLLRLLDAATRRDSVWH